MLWVASHPPRDSDAYGNYPLGVHPHKAIPSGAPRALARSIDTRLLHATHVRRDRCIMPGTLSRCAKSGEVSWAPQKQRTMTRVLPASLLSVALLGCEDVPELHNDCAPPDSAVPADAGNKISVSGWWDTVNEGYARDGWEGLNELHRSIPGNEGDDFPLFSGDQSVQSLRGTDNAIGDRTLARIAQANVGANLFRWGSLLEPLEDGLAEEVRREFYAPLLELITPSSEHGRPYCVPLGIHRVNTLFYNKSVLENLGESVQDEGFESLQELEELLRRLAHRSASGEASTAESEKVVPLQVTTEPSWTFGQFVHETLLAALIGAADYRSFWLGKMNDDEVQGALRTVYTRLLKWREDGMIVDTGQGYWPAIRDFPKFKVAFLVAGDWATGAMNAAFDSPPKNVGRMGFPSADSSTGTSSPSTAVSLVYSADCFPMHRGTVDYEAAMRLFRTMASRDGQCVFCAKKGCVPARPDAVCKDLEETAPHLREVSGTSNNYQRFLVTEESLSSVPALSAMIPYTVLANHHEILVDMWRLNDLDVAMKYWEKSYQELRDWAQSRRSSGE